MESEKEKTAFKKKKKVAEIMKEYYITDWGESPYRIKPQAK